tara:strand:+ start:266 stop:1507 length:1242 start_codon:yes stop_codon:yes gene_type:complete
MAIPFFSLDLKLRDFLLIIKDIFLPYDKKGHEKKLKELLKDRYPDRYISILPSARLGFYLSLKFLLKKDDEVIFSSMSFPLYIKIAKQLGLKITLVDVCEQNLNIDYLKIEHKINKNTKAIVATHLFGYPCEIEKIKNICEKHNLLLIEDCAQSFNSKLNNIETGNFGDVGISSTSLLKIPTTLSGGILVTKNKVLSEKIDEWQEKYLKNNLTLKFQLFIKVILSILNSYPKIYSILSDKIFNFLIKYNPRIYRKVLYSGMGMNDLPYNPVERPRLAKYQISVGISQIKRCEEMNKIRKKYSEFLQKSFKDNNNIIVINDHYKEQWNHQYFVILIKNNFDKVHKEIFNLGIHAMDENVWDCSKYNFNIENVNDSFPVTEMVNGKLLRIQNNSFLNEKNIQDILEKIINGNNKI